MDSSLVITLAPALLVAAFLYASVGHGGASAYLAAMALAGMAPAEMRPIALQLNVLVSLIATVKFGRAGLFRWRLFWPFALASIPAAALGGTLVLPGTSYRVLVGVVLVYAAWQMWWSARSGEEARARRALSLPVAIAIGAVLGLLSGLTGVGGGIFLSPLLVLLGWAGTRETSAVAAPFILVNSLAGLAPYYLGGGAAPALDLAPLWVAVVIGGFFGAEYGSRRFSSSFIRQMLAVVLAIAGGKMVLA